MICCMIVQISMVIVYFFLDLDVLGIKRVLTSNFKALQNWLID